MKKLAKHVSGQNHQYGQKVDGVKRYSKNALTLCYLAKDFLDARKRGDGERICRLYKHMLPLFKLDGRTKYANQSLHLISQLTFLLPPALAHQIKWNRFVNNKGLPDSNIELDRELEHRNKFVKEDIHSFHGKVTKKSIERSSKSYDILNKLSLNFDSSVNNAVPSGKHTSPDWKSDVKELIDLFKNQELFQNKEGRYFKSFPVVPENFLQLLETEKFDEWKNKKMKEFGESSLYQHRYSTINN